MSSLVPIIVSAVVGTVASKVIAGITGNETLGMIAGIAAGGFASGSILSAGQSASGTAAAQAGAKAAQAGTTLGGSNASLLGSGVADIASAAQGVPTEGFGFLAKTGGQVAPAAGTGFVDSVTKGFKDLFSGGASGGAEGAKANDTILGGFLKKTDVPELAFEAFSRLGNSPNNKMADLRRDEFNFQKQLNAERSAFGVNRAGGGQNLAPVVAARLKEIEDRMAAAGHRQGGSALGSFTNINTSRNLDGSLSSTFSKTRQRREEQLS